MSKHEIASLSLKIMGLLTILQSFFVVSSRILFITSDKVEVNIFGLLMFIIPSLFGVALLLYSDRFASMLVAKESQISEAQPVTAYDFQTIAFSIVGLVLIVSALLQLMDIVLRFVFVNQSISVMLSINPQMYIDLCVHLFELFIGCLLLLSSHSITKMLQR